MTIKIAIFDVDGTLTDGQIIHADAFDGHQDIIVRGRSFSTLDGKGIQLLRESGVQVWICGGDDSPHLKDRLDWLGIAAEHRLLGPTDKRDILKLLPPLETSEIAFIGNDDPDLPLMANAGLVACPADAHKTIRDYVQWRERAGTGYICAEMGGYGAVREFCDYIIKLNAIETIDAERKALSDGYMAKHHGSRHGKP